MGFSRQEYCCRLPFPFPGDLPNPVLKPGSPLLQADSLSSEPPGKPKLLCYPLVIRVNCKFSLSLYFFFSFCILWWFQRTMLCVCWFFCLEVSFLFHSGLLSFSCLVVSDFLWPHGLQHARLACPSLSPKVCSNHVHWVDDDIQLSHPQSLPSPPALNLLQHQGLFKWVSISHQVAKVLELQHPIFPVNNQHWFPLIDWFDLLAVSGTFKSLFFFLLSYFHSSTYFNKLFFFLLFIRWISKPLTFSFFKDFFSFLTIILILFEYSWFTILCLFQMYRKVIQLYSTYIHSFLDSFLI